MSQQYCFLCASDGGVFLDITEDNKQVYYDQFEICSLVKVPKANELPTRICHKCAYELNQCSTFIKKFKRNTKQKTNVRKQCCNLCREPAKNEFIFDLVKEKNLQQNIFFKIRKVFNHELDKFWEEFKFICLSCRYTIDVLLDLQHICEETANNIKFNNTNNKETNNLIFHKVKTTVISRKTTITESKRVNLSILRESETDSDNMTRTRSQNQLNKKTMLKSCNKCHDSIKTDDDMYKIHETGNIVCKNCWKNMNIYKNETEKQKQQNLTEIKLCTVFLKDVLKDSDIKAKKLYRINEDDEGNKTYIIMDNDLKNENKSNKEFNNIENNIEKQGQKRSIKDINENTNNEYTPNKKHKSNIKEINDINLKETIHLRQKNRNRNNIQNSDSDSSVSKTTKRKQRTLTIHKRAIGLSLSDADVDNKYSHKRLKGVLRGISVKNIDESDESLSNEDVSKRKRTRLTSAPPESGSLRKRKNNSQKRSMNFIDLTSYEFQSLESDNNKEDIFQTQTYVCDECGASYENKMIGLTHKLSHYKQLRLKIQKLSDERIKEILSSNEAIDDHVEDLSESIVISIEDDEEELIEDEKNLNVNNHANVFSSKKEVIEDAVDVKLVMKEFDDDQIQKIENEKETEIKTNVDISSIQNENEIEKDIVIETEKNNKTKNNCTDNDKTDKNICEFDENTKSEEIQKNSDKIYNNNEDLQEKYKEEKQIKDDQENSGTKIEEKKKSDDIVERKKEKENNDIKEREEESDIEDREDVKKNINNKDNEKEKEQKEIIYNEEEKEQEQTMHIEEEKEQEEMKHNEEEIKTNKESKSNEDFVEFTMNKNEIQTPFKVIEQNGIEKKEVNDRNNSIQNTKQKLFECRQERKSDESAIYTKIDSFDSKESKLETNILLEEENIINKNDLHIDKAKVKLNISTQEELMNESANVVAEVLREVLDLASAKVEERQESIDISARNNFIETETLENISHEIQNTVDMPSLKVDNIIDIE